MKTVTTLMVLAAVLVSSPATADPVRVAMCADAYGLTRPCAPTPDAVALLAGGDSNAAEVYAILVGDADTKTVGALPKIAYAATSACDVVTTRVVLGQGGRELNPFLSWAGTPDAIMLLAMATKVGTGLLAESRNSEALWWVVAGINAVPCVANSTQIR